MAIIALTNQKTGSVVNFASWELPSETEAETKKLEIISLKVFSDTDNAIVVISNGDVFNAQGLDRSVELVGSFDQTILAAEWSPDEEILAIATSKSLIYLSRGFDPIVETCINIKDLSFSKHVSVGWGKSETQFQGKGAKAMRDPTMPIKVDSGIITNNDDRSVSLSWRGDGEYVAMMSVDDIPDSVSKRTIRVYSRSGNLTNVSEPVDTMEGTIAWRPSGNVIASVQRNSPTNSDESPDLIFFERNGLRRYEFPLRISINEQVRQLAWNSDSDVLAILLYDRIQLWTTKNYHWYLKQEIASRSSSVSVIEWIQWHPEKPYTIFVGYKQSGNSQDCSDYRIETHTFLTGLISGPLVAPNDLGTVVSLDGTKVKVTPLAIANVPPPMAFREFELPSNVIHVSVSESNKLFACLTSTTVFIVEWDPFTKPVKTPVTRATVLLNEYLTSSNHKHVVPKQVAYLNDNKIAVVGDCETGSVITIFSLDLEDSNKNITVFPKILFNRHISPDVFILKAQLDGNAFVLETIDGVVHKISGGESDEHEIDVIGSFPRLCSDFQVVSHTNDSYNVYGITDSGRLYANQRQLSSSVTSMQLTTNHCLFTTAQHYLKFCHLQPDVEDIVIPADDSEHDERCRSIERGSLLVTTMPSRTAVVLQAPRGNLETIFPRILVLTKIRKHIFDMRYDLAFALCRVHRIDLNLLHDSSSSQFFENICMIVKQLGSVEYIDLFLSELKEEDVSQTLYKSTLEDSIVEVTEDVQNLNLTDNKDRSPSSFAPSSLKINSICDGILSIITQDSFKTKYQQSILTAHACKSPPDLEAALTIVSQFLESSPSQAEICIQHLCFLQDVELLYRTALGMYNLDLTLLVAQHSQKDPKEYLPFLRNLQQQEQWRLRFMVDDYLKRYSKALSDLNELGDAAFDELKDYVKHHSLFQNALGLFKYVPSRQNEMLLLYAENLSQNHNFREAGLTYESLGDHTLALKNYILGSDWKKAVVIIDDINEESKGDSHENGSHIDSKGSLYLQLAEQILEGRGYRDAATIYLEYLNDVPKAVASYCKGSYYDDAIRVCSKHNVNELIASIVDPGLNEGFAYTSELLSDCKNQLNSQVRRLRELRVAKQSDPMGFYGGGPEETDAPDNISLAPTESSTAPSYMTQYTGKTSGTAKTGASRKTAKNRRREERKRARGKKGTIYEEEYLISSVGRLIERVHDSEVEAIRLIEGLLRRQMRTHAFQLQRNFVQIVENLKAVVQEVFTLSEKDRQRYDDNGNIYYVPQIAIPDIKEFKRFATLDYDVE